MFQHVLRTLYEEEAFQCAHSFTIATAFRGGCSSDITDNETEAQRRKMTYQNYHRLSNT